MAATCVLPSHHVERPLSSPRVHNNGLVINTKLANEPRNQEQRKAQARKMQSHLQSQANRQSGYFESGNFGSYQPMQMTPPTSTESLKLNRPRRRSTVSRTNRAVKTRSQASLNPSLPTPPLSAPGTAMYFPAADWSLQPGPSTPVTGYTSVRSVGPHTQTSNSQRDLRLLQAPQSGSTAELTRGRSMQHRPRRHGQSSSPLSPASKSTEGPQREGRPRSLPPSRYRSVSQPRSQAPATPQSSRPSTREGRRVSTIVPDLVTDPVPPRRPSLITPSKSWCVQATPLSPTPSNSSRSVQSAVVVSATQKVRFADNVGISGREQKLDLVRADTSDSKRRGSRRKKQAGPPRPYPRGAPAMRTVQVKSADKGQAALVSVRPVGDEVRSIDDFVTKEKSTEEIPVDPNVDADKSEGVQAKRGCLAVFWRLFLPKS